MRYTNTRLLLLLLSTKAGIGGNEYYRVTDGSAGVRAHK